MHWAYFDKAQEAHLTLCRNVADFDVLVDIAREIGLDVDRFKADLSAKKLSLLCTGTWIEPWSWAWKQRPP